MLIVLGELKQYFTEENVNATVVKIIKQTIQKDIKILKDERPENRGVNYYAWKRDVTNLKATVQEFDELYELLDQRLPNYEEKCRLLYKDKTNWHKGKNDEAERHIAREWIIEKHWEFRQKSRALKLENSKLIANKSKAEKDEYLNTIRFMENKKNELADFLSFIDNELKGKVNDCYVKVSNSKRLCGLTIELEPELLLNHLRSKTPVKKESVVDFNSNQNQQVPIYIFNGKDTCLTKGHKIENVKAHVKNLKAGTNDVMNILYCQHCKQYRISFISYQNYTKNNLIPAVIIRTVKNEEANGLNDHSVLSLYGYSVGQNSLSEHARHRILAYLLDARIATKAQILDLLRFDITYPGKRKGMEESVKNWNADIRFVNDYKIARQREVCGKFDRSR